VPQCLAEVFERSLRGKCEGAWYTMVPSGFLAPLGGTIAVKPQPTPLDTEL